MSAAIFIFKTLMLVVVALAGFLALASSLGAEPFSQSAQLCSAQLNKTCLFSIY